MPCLISRNVTTILGQTGSGKTTLARQLINSLPRALILDAGFKEFSAIDFMEAEALREYLDDRGTAGKNFRVTYTPTPSEYGWLFRVAREIGDRGEALTLVLEECDRFPNVDSRGDFEEIITRGRHYGVHLLNISTYPANVDIDLRRQTTDLYTFRQTEPRDLKWLSEVMTPEVLDKVQELPDYQYIRWCPKTRQLTEGKTTL